MTCARGKFYYSCLELILPQYLGLIITCFEVKRLKKHLKQSANMNIATLNNVYSPLIILHE